MTHFHGPIVKSAQLCARGQSEAMGKHGGLVILLSCAALEDKKLVSGCDEKCNGRVASGDTKGILVQKLIQNMGIMILQNLATGIYMPAIGTVHNGGYRALLAHCYT